MEVIPVGVPLGQLSRSLVNQCPFLDFYYGRHRSKSSFNRLEGKDLSENRNLIRSRSDAISAGSQSSLGRGRRATKSVRLLHESVVSRLNRPRPSSNRDDQRFALGFYHSTSDQRFSPSEDRQAIWPRDPRAFRSGLHKITL